MPALTLHAVRTIEDSIGAGSHFLNRALSKAVLVTFHNVMASKITTNADHEPARRVLLRMFIAICLCLTHSFAKNAEPLPQRYLDHIPNLYTPAGLVDYFAIRTFVVLFPALCSDSYPHIVRDGKHEVLPINPDVWDEVQYAWKLAVQVEGWLRHNYNIVITDPGTGIEGQYFNTVADVSFILHNHNHAQLAVVCHRLCRYFVAQISRRDHQGAG